MNQISSNIQDSVFNVFKPVQPDYKAPVYSPSHDAGDSFSKTSKTPDIEYPNPPVYQPAPKSNINFKPKDAALLLSTTVAIAATIGFIVSGRGQAKLKDTISSLAAKNDELQNSISGLQSKLKAATDELAENSKIKEQTQGVIDELKKKLDNFKGSEGNFFALRDERVKYYEDLISDVSLSYDPMKPPVEVVQKASNHVKTLFPFREIQGSVREKRPDRYTEGLFRTLKEDGYVSIERACKSNPHEKVAEALLKDTETQTGVFSAAGIKLNYGKRAAWSNNRISRDIMQNFYDANGHTMDGVGVAVDKIGGGGYRIKVSGNGVFDANSLLELGSGNKLAESPYNAGGFGEGSRMVVASLLGQDKSSSVKFASADWQMEFKPRGSSIVRKIDKVPLLDGNFIEFETKDEDLVHSLLKSINFFNGSSNADFQDTTFMNKNFGFKILKPGQKGNLYLTQRFEYDAPENWENCLEGLDLIFKRKPDSQEFEKFAGKAFSTGGRDRTCFNYRDICDLTGYFGSELSDKELIDAILGTQPHWATLKNGDDSAIKAFINGLCSAAKKKGAGIDFGGIKICKAAGYESEAILKYVQSCGYTILPSDVQLDKVGMITSMNVFEMLSSHTPVSPNEIEIKKLKLLEEATGAIQKSISETYPTKLKSIIGDTLDIIAPATETEAYCVVSDLKHSNSAEHLVKKYINKDGYITVHDVAAFAKDFKEYYKGIAESVNPQNIDEYKDAISALMGLMRLSSHSNSENIRRAHTQLSNLQIIDKSDVKCPRYIFDRFKEPAISTLGEAIIKGKKYQGHWVDKSYLDKGSFYDLVATWLHEISHKSGGDGTSEFTYKLTDLIEAILDAASNSPDLKIELSAIEKVFNSLPLSA